MSQRAARGARWCGIVSRSVATCVLLAAIGRNTAHADPEFTAFHARFRNAVAANDAAAVADLVRLPFLFDGKSRDRREFLRIYPALFTPNVRRCFASASAVVEDRGRVIFCAPYAFYFERRGGAWKLDAFNADGEDTP